MAAAPGVVIQLFDRGGSRVIPEDELMGKTFQDVYLNGGSQQTIVLNTTQNGILIDLHGAAITGPGSGPDTGESTENSLAWGIVDYTQTDYQSGTAPNRKFGVNRYGQVVGETILTEAQAIYFSGDIDTHLKPGKSIAREGGDFWLEGGEGRDELGSGYNSFGGTVHVLGGDPGAGSTNRSGGVDIDSGSLPNGNSATVRAGAPLAGDIAIGQLYAKQIIIGPSGQDGLGTTRSGSGTRIYAGDAGMYLGVFGAAGSLQGSIWRHKFAEADSIPVWRSGGTGNDRSSAMEIWGGLDAAGAGPLRIHAVANATSIDGAAITLDATDLGGSALSWAISTGATGKLNIFKTSSFVFALSIDTDGSVSLGNASAKQGFFGGAGAVQQAVAALTNSVTSGGSSDVIADFADLTTYSNSAAAIRNNIYQLARKVAQLTAAVRAYGLVS